MAKFKVGQKVRIVRDCRDVGHDVGSIVTLRYQYDDGSWSTKESEYWWPECDLEFANSFNPGDKVKIVRNSRGCEHLNSSIGEVVTIEKYVGNCGFASDTPGYETHESPYWWPEEDLELVEEPKVLSKGEALGVALEGFYVCPVGNKSIIVFWDRANSRFGWYNQGEKSLSAAMGVLNRDQWEICECPESKPKFSKGDTFVTKDGRTGKVVEYEHVYGGEPRYTVEIMCKNPHFPESKMLKSV